MRFGLFLAPLVLVAVAIAAPVKPDPLTVLKKTDRELREVLVNEKEETLKKKKIRALVKNLFDFREMGKKALGKDTWKEMSDKQKDEFIEAFTGIVTNASVKRLEVYETDSVVYKPPKTKDNKATITVHTFQDGIESILVYKMIHDDEEWKTWDLVIDDLSTYRNYRGQFDQILKSKTIDELIALLQKKVEKEEEKRTADDRKSESEKKASAESDATSSK